MIDTIKKTMKKCLSYKYCEIILIIVYKIILDFIFLVFMKNYNVYYNFNVFKLIMSIPLILVLHKVILMIKEDIIRIILKVFYLIMFIPISTIYMGKNFSTFWYLMIFLEMILIVATVKIISYLINKKILEKIRNKLKFKINYSFTTNIIFILFITNTIIALGLCIYYNGFPSFEALNLYKVYDIREQFYLPKYANYLYKFETTFILPFLLALFLYKKDYKKTMAIILVQLLLYLIQGEKIILFSTGLILCTYYIYYYKHKYIEKVLPIGLIMLCLISIIVFGFSEESDFILALFITRLLIIPANLKFMYFDFFSSHPKIGVVGTLLNAVLKFPNPYGEGMPYQNLIAGIYLNDYNMYSDTGMLAEGYARFGYIGLLVIPIIMSIVLHVINYGTKRNEKIFILCISIFPIMLLNEGYLLPTLMSGGILLLLGTCIFFDVNKLETKQNKKRIETKNVIILSDEPFEPDIRVYREAKYLIKKGYEVEVVCLDKKNKFKDKPTEIYDGIKIKRFFCRTEKSTQLIEKYRIMQKLKYIIYFYWLLKFIYLVKKYLKNKNFTILHCQNLIMSFIGVTFFKSKEIVFDMREYYENRNNRLLDFIIKKVNFYTQDKAKWIIHVNEFQKKQCKEKNYSKLIEIPNYQEKEAFEDAKKTKCNKIRVSYIGKVRDFSSLSKLIDNSDNHEQLQVAIYGNGSEYEKLLEYAKNQGKEFVMKGSYNSIEDSKEIYNNTDILYAVYNTNSFTANNWKNAMPIKSFEAIVTLTPIIASKNTVLGDFVEKYDIGFTINDKDSEEISEVFELLSKNPQTIHKKIENMKKIQYMYTWEEVSKKLEKIY